MKVLAFCAALTLFPAAVSAGDWERFARFWGYILAVEDHCESYLAYTDATMNDDLSAEEWAAAQNRVPEFRQMLAGRVLEIGCDEAARESAALSDLAFNRIWEVR